MPIKFNNTNISKVMFNGVEMQKVVFNGTTVYTSEVSHSITSDGRSYNGTAYPTSQGTSETLRTGASSSSSNGCIIAFPITAAVINGAKTDVTLTLKFSSSNYLSSMKFINPEKKLIPMLVNGQTNTTNFTTFNNLATTSYTNTISGNNITITIPNATFKGYSDDLVTINGNTYLTFGIKCQYNATYLYRTTNTLSFTGTV